MSELIRDLRYAFRLLLKHPSLAVIVVITLALCIGANTAIFSVVNAIVFRPLPYAAPNQLVGIWTRDMKRPGSQHPAALPTIRDSQQQTQTMSDIATYAFNHFHVTGLRGPTRRVASLQITSLFDVLRVRPALGRSARRIEAHARTGDPVSGRAPTRRFRLSKNFFLRQTPATLRNFPDVAEREKRLKCSNSTVKLYTMANYDANLKKVDQFLLDVLENRTSEAAQQQVGSSFYGIQAPWYTVFSG